jgi:hypothetical protein
MIPDFVALTRRVLDRLAQQPASAVVDGERVVVGRDELQTLIVLQSGDREFISALPLLLGSMDRGDFTGRTSDTRGSQAAAGGYGDVVRDGPGVRGFVCTGRAHCIRVEGCAPWQRDQLSVRRPADAIGLLEAGLELFPSDAFLLIRMGDIEVERRNPDAARRYFERVLAADPLAEAARVELERLGGR